MFWVADHVGNTQLVDTREATNIACRDAIHFHAVEAHKAVKIDNAAFALCAIRRGDDNILLGVQCAAHNAANPDHARIGTVIQRGDLQLQGRIWIHIWDGRIFDYRLKQRRHICAFLVGLIRRPAIQGRREDNGEV